MKKIISIFLVVFVWQVAFAGDFKFFTGDQSLYIFSKDSATYDNIIPLAYQFDHKTPIDEGFILKAYNYQNYYGINDMGGYNPFSSWVGDSVILYTDGNTRIINQYGCSLFFKTMTDTEPWVIFQAENGARMEGRYTGFQLYNTFPGTDDFIGTIEISVYDSLGNIFSNHPYQNFKMIISQNFGVIKTFSLNSFFGIYEQGDLSINESAYHLVGVKTDDTQYGFLYRFSPIVSRVDVGTETHYSFSYLDKEDNGYYEIKRKYLDKAYNDSLVIYQIQECIHYQLNDIDTIYSNIFEESYHYRLRPQEVRFVEDPSEQSYIQVYQMSRDGDFENRESFSFSIFDLDHSFEYNGKTLWSTKPDFGYSMGTYAIYEFIDGLGKIKRYRGENGTGDELVYYKTPYDEWGEPLEFTCPDNTGIEETQSTKITLYPNPAEDVIYLKSPLKMDRVNIFDLQGRLVKQFELKGQTSLNVSDLESGVYLMEIQNGNIILMHQKMIIR